MVTIIAGSRSITDKDEVFAAIASSGILIDKIVTGGCKGVDSIAEEYAKRNNIPLEVFEANWSKYGRAAGPARNKTMVEHADSLIAIMSEGGSKGTQSIIREAKKKGLLVYVHTVR